VVLHEKTAGLERDAAVRAFGTRTQGSRQRPRRWRIDREPWFMEGDLDLPVVDDLFTDRLAP